MDPFSQPTPQPGYPAPGPFGQPDYPAPQTPYPQSQPGYPGGAYQPGAFPAYPGQSQPGYTPAPPGYPAQNQPPRSNRTRILVITFIVLVILLGGGIATYAIVQAQNTPTATLQRFCDGMTHLNAAEVYETLSTQYQQQSSLTTIQQGFDEVRSSGGSIVNCAVSNVQQYDTAASGSLTFTVIDNSGSSPRTSTASVTLVQENGQWRINSLSSNL